MRLLHCTSRHAPPMGTFSKGFEASRNRSAGVAFVSISCNWCAANKVPDARRSSRDHTYPQLPGAKGASWWMPVERMRASSRRDAVTCGIGEHSYRDSNNNGDQVDRQLPKPNAKQDPGQRSFLRDTQRCTYLTLLRPRYYCLQLPEYHRYYTALHTQNIPRRYCACSRTKAWSRI
ncbi:hypothetical protein F4801DRAFT_551140 [Xylaria longipes]|nr:hypothetical protein F4801DRAFT_551140 [Xylaria longipes]